MDSKSERKGEKNGIFVLSLLRTERMKCLNESYGFLIMSTFAEETTFHDIFTVLTQMYVRVCKLVSISLNKQ